jgi:hypothetical protein
MPSLWWQRGLVVVEALWEQEEEVMGDSEGVEEAAAGSRQLSALVVVG